jgi:hypothetical protein
VASFVRRSDTRIVEEYPRAADPGAGAPRSVRSTPTRSLRPSRRRPGPRDRGLPSTSTDKTHVGVDHPLEQLVCLSDDGQAGLLAFAGFFRSLSACCARASASRALDQ